MSTGANDALPRLDKSEGRPWRGHREIAVGPEAFTLLCYFVCNPDRLLSKEEILDALWPDTFVSEGL